VTQHRRRLTTAAAAVTGALVLGAALTGCTNDEPPGELPTVTLSTTTTTTTTVTLTPTEQAIKDAKDTYTKYREVTRAVATSGGHDMDAYKALDGVAVGDALAQQQYLQRAFIDKGWTAHGPLPLVWVKATKASPKAVTLESCADGRKAYVTDRGGKRVKVTSPQYFDRTTAVLKPVEGSWKVTTVETIGADKC
jgi:hypothetical protein